MGVEKIYTSAYHLQTDGLVEQFNCMLLDTCMFVNSVSPGFSEWDRDCHMSYLPTEPLCSHPLASLLSSHCMETTYSNSSVITEQWRSVELKSFCVALNQVRCSSWEVPELKKAAANIKRQLSAIVTLAQDQ